MAEGGGLPSVDFVFRPQGVAEVMSAFKSIEDAARRSAASTSNEDVKQARIRAGLAKVEATEAVKLAKVASDAKVREAQRSTREMEREADRQKRAIEKVTDAAKKAAEVNRDAFGNRVGFGADRGLRQISSSRAFEQVFGKTAAQLAGLQGGFGVALGAVNAFRSGLAMASTALTQFGGYVLSDIIKPQLRLGTTSTQIANRIGGNAGAIQGQINGLYKSNAQVDLNQVTAAFSKAADIVKDPAKVGKVADLALQANKAYGYDPMKMTEFVARKRAANMGMSDAQFGGMMSGQIALAQKNGAGTVEDLISSIGAMQNMTSRFAITSPDGTINQAAATARENELTGLLTASTAKGGSAAGLQMLMTDMQKNAPGKATYAGTGTLKPLMESLPALIASVGGDITKLGAGSKVGKTLTSYSLGGGYNGGSINELRALGLGETYQSAELQKKGSGAGAVAAQLKAMLEPAAQASKLVDDAKRVEAETGYSLEQSMRDLQMAIVESFLPVLKTEGPKIAAIMKDISGALAEHGTAIVGVFGMITTTVATVMAALLGLVPDSMLSDNAKKVQSGLQSFLNPDTSTDGGSSVEAKIAADKKLHPEKYNSGALGTFFTHKIGVEGSGDLAGGTGGFGGGLFNAKAAAASLAGPSVKPGSEGGDPRVQGPAAPFDPAAVGKAIGTEAAKAISANLAMNDPARTNSGAAPPPDR